MEGKADAQTAVIIFRVPLESSKGQITGHTWHRQGPYLIIGTASNPLLTISTDWA